MFRFVGKDVYGVRRVYGYADTKEEAWHQCRQAILGYVKRRPDTGPASHWSTEEITTGPIVVIDAHTGEPVGREQMEKRFRADTKARQARIRQRLSDG